MAINSTVQKLTNPVVVAARAVTGVFKKPDQQAETPPTGNGSNGPQTAPQPEPPAIENRVRICLPPAAGPIFYGDTTNRLLNPLAATDGFLLPFQPQVQLGYEAQYTSVNPTHSNFAYHHYAHSQIRPITITAEFLLRTAVDARYVQAGLHFLKSCTRMFNWRDGERAGSPPQVLRLKGGGFNGFDNLPVVLSSLDIMFPENVDYITFYLDPSSRQTGFTRLPVNFTATMTFNPVFSRNFITNTYSTTKFSDGSVRLFGPESPFGRSVPEIPLNTTAEQIVQADATLSNLGIPSQVPGLGGVPISPPPPT